MPTAPRTIAEHHHQQAELTLTALGSLAATPEEATREAAAALAHAVLAIVAQLIAEEGRLWASASADSIGGNGTSMTGPPGKPGRG